MFRIQYYDQESVKSYHPMENCNSKETTNVGHYEFKSENYVEKRDEDANKKQDSSSNKSTTNASEENKEENKPVIKPKEDEKKRNQ